MAATSAIGVVVENVVEISRVLDGTIIDPVTGARSPATAESRTAADNAVTVVMGAFLDGLSFPFSLGTMGSLDRAEVNAMLGKIVPALRIYCEATKK